MSSIAQTAVEAIGNICIVEWSRLTGGALAAAGQVTPAPRHPIGNARAKIAADASVLERTVNSEGRDLVTDLRRGNLEKKK